MRQEKNLQRIFRHYLEKFDYMNKNQSTEWYKWKIAMGVPGLRMDRALVRASEEDFPVRMMQVQKLTENLIDNYTQPFYGLYGVAKEPEEFVRCSVTPFMQTTAIIEPLKPRRFSHF